MNFIVTRNQTKSQQFKVDATDADAAESQVKDNKIKPASHQSNETFSVQVDPNPPKAAQPTTSTKL